MVQKVTGWWQASDSNWYPPELHPSNLGQDQDSWASDVPAQGRATSTEPGGLGPDAGQPGYIPPHKRRRALLFDLPEHLMPPEGQVVEGWWQAADGNWYPPELHPDYHNETLDPPAGALGMRVKLRRNWSWLGLNLGKYAGIVGIVGLVVSLVLGLGLLRLRFTTSDSSYLNSTDPAAIENTSYQHIFGGDPIVTMLTMEPGSTVDTFFTSTNLAALSLLESKLRANSQVFSVAGPSDSLQLANALAQSPGGNPASSIAGQWLLSADQSDPSPTSQALRLKYMSGLLAAQSAIAPTQQVITNPNWVHFLIHNPDGTLRPAILAFIPNETHLAIVTYLRGGISIGTEANAAASVQQIVNSVHFQGATVLTTGVPALLDTINNYLRGGMFSLSLLAGALMILILALAFSVRWRLLAFATVAVGLLWAFGLVGYLGIPLTLGSIAGLPILMGVGIDYAIQMHSRVEEEVVLDRANHPIQATARNLGPALLVVTFDAVFAFCALLFARVPMIRQFGQLLVVGIIAVCVFSIIGPLAVLGIREYRSPTRGKDFSGGILSRFVVFLGSLPEKAAVALALGSLAIFAGGLIVEGHLTLQTDPIQWVNQKSPAIEGISALMQGTGSENELGVIVRTDQPFSNQTVEYIANLSDRLEQRYPSALFPGIGLVNFVDQLMAIPGTTPIHPTGQEVLAAYNAAPEAIKNLMVANGGTEMNIVFRARTSSLSSLQPVVQYLQDQKNLDVPAGMSVAPGGIAVVGVGLLTNLARSRLLLTYLAIGFVGLFLIIRLRSFVRSLLSLVPVLIAVGAVSLVADAFSLKLSPMTAVAGPLVVAVCTEFTSLMLLRFVEERGRGLDPRNAIDMTAQRTGRAFLVSAMTAICGIGVMATSSMPLLRGFGIIVAMNVGVALFCALVILPPILVWADQPERLWVSKRLTISYEEPRQASKVSVGV